MTQEEETDYNRLKDIELAIDNLLEDYGSSGMISTSLLWKAMHP